MTTVAMSFIDDRAWKPDPSYAIGTVGTIKIMFPQCNFLAPSTGICERI